MNETIEETIKKSKQINQKYQTMQNQIKLFLIQSDKTNAKVDNTLKLVTNTLVQVSETQNKIASFEKSFSQAINRVADSVGLQYPNGFSVQTNVQQIVDIINKSTKILILTGAGISALSGIRTFRGQGGLYDEIQDQQWGTPQKILTEWYFDFKPSLVWQEMMKFSKQIQNSNPNINHLCIQQLIDICLKMNKKINLMTLNIDNLQQKAQKQKKTSLRNQQKFNFFQIGGNIYKMRCQNCTFKAQSLILKQFNLKNLDKIKYCQKCKSMLRPHFTFYDESLNQIIHKWNDITNFIKKECDLMIIIGASLKTKCAQKLVNQAIEKNMNIIQINISPQIDYKNNRYIADKVQMIFPKLLQLFKSLPKKIS